MRYHIVEFTFLLSIVLLICFQFIFQVVCAQFERELAATCVEFLLMIQQSWICELLPRVPLIEGMSIDSAFKKYVDDMSAHCPTLKVYHRACYTDINVILDMYHAKELRGLDATSLYHSSLKRLLRMVTVGNCPQYCQNIIYELRQLFDMSSEMRALYEASTTSVMRERNKRDDAGKFNGDRSTFFCDEFLESMGIKVAKMLISSQHLDKVMETGRALNVMSGYCNTAHKFFFSTCLDEIRSRVSRNKLCNIEARLAITRALFRKHVIPTIVKEVS